MTDATTPATPPARVENVQNGTLLALATIPFAAVLAALVGGLFGIISGLVAIVIPTAAVWLYERGAGAPLTRRGWVPVILVSVVSIGAAIVAGFVGTAYNAYSAVGNREPFGPAFWTTVRIQMTGPDAILPILIGVGLGAIGLFGILRRPRPAATQQAAATQHPVAQEQQPPAPPAPPAAS